VGLEFQPHGEKIHHRQHQNLTEIAPLELRAYIYVWFARQARAQSPHPRPAIGAPRGAPWRG